MRLIFPNRASGGLSMAWETQPLTVDLARFNSLSAREAQQVLFECCGSTRWAERMASQRPFASFKALCESAERVWFDLDRSDWLEAFSHHPKIGERNPSTTRQTQRWSEQEQAAALAGMRQDVRAALAEANRAYQEHFGYIFIVCASTKTSEEILALLRSRLQNGADRELRIAAEEQLKITQLRLKKLWNTG